MTFPMLNPNTCPWQHDDCLAHADLGLQCYQEYRAFIFSLRKGAWVRFWQAPFMGTGTVLEFTGHRIMVRVLGTEGERLTIRPFGAHRLAPP